MMKLELSRDDLKRTKGEIRHLIKIKRYKGLNEVKNAIDYHIIQTVNLNLKQDENCSY
jgi:hypothetical protein